MWDAVAKALTNENTWMVLVFLAVFIVLIAVLAKIGLITVHTKALKIGSDENERNIIRRQVDWTHFFIMSLEAKIQTDTTQYGGYFTKYVLECVYDEIVKWIMQNHITTAADYIEVKQEIICAIVYSMGVRDEFKTKEFKQRMCNWTREVIERLVQIRGVYK